MTITSVAARTESYNNSGGQGSLAITTSAIGDLIVVTADVTSPTITLTGVSGGNAGSWTQVCAPLYDSAVANSQSMWKGVVTSTGAGTLTFTYSAAIGTTGVQRVFQMFHSSNGASTTWTVEASNEQVNAAATTGSFPTLTAGGTGRLYFGLCAVVSGFPTGSTTGGWVWDNTDTYLDLLLYNLSVGSGSVTPPTTGTGTSQKSVALGALFSDASPATPPRVVMSPYNSFH